MIVAVGMDPGPKPGLVKLVYSEQRLVGVYVVQCSLNCALDTLETWLRQAEGLSEIYVQVEKFVIGSGSYRAGSPGRRTRDLVGSALTLATGYGAHALQRPASDAKTWASNGRLLAAGIEADVKGMPHARDAARHALYTACKDANIPDPFSRRAKRDGG